MKPLADDGWRRWVQAISAAEPVVAVHATSSGTAFGPEAPGASPWSLDIPWCSRYSLGIDVVGYGREAPGQQILLTATLLMAVEAARDRLRALGWIGVEEPDVQISVGDGAILLFEHLPSAIVLLLAANALWVRATGAAAPGGRAVRYALARGPVANVSPDPAAPNAVGDAVSRCDRLLAALPGPHLLVEDEIVSEVQAAGGLARIVRAACAWEIGDELTTRAMPPVQIKTTRLAFHNVAGTYDAGPVLLEIAPAPPQTPVLSRRCPIGTPAG